MTRAGRRIHARAPWAVPGSNVPAPVPWQRPEAPQRPVDAWDVADESEPRRLPQRLSPRMTMHYANVETVRYGPPPRVPAGTPAVDVFIDGEKVSVPSNWRIAFSSKGDRDALYALDTAGVLHILIVDSQGQLKAMEGLSEAFIEDVLRWRFGSVRR